MAWTYATVKAADAALSPAVADPGAAAAALNAQTTTQAVPVSIATLHGILMLASTSDWDRITVRSAAAYSSGWPANPATTDAAIAAAKLAVSLAGSKVDSVSVADWPGFLAPLQVLQTAGDVSAASYTAIAALGSVTAATWQPALTAGDIQTARAQP
ncbi:MAG TPA: hypothetical protein VL356_01700 [Acidocella sp.]|nr:hypothetical protein [Acidocella sp.]